MRMDEFSSPAMTSHRRNRSCLPETAARPSRPYIGPAMDGDFCAGHFAHAVQRGDMIPMPMREENQLDLPRINMELLHVIDK